jgi:hypothetical protein
MPAYGGTKDLCAIFGNNLSGVVLIISNTHVIVPKDHIQIKRVAVKGESSGKQSSMHTNP